jgi:hypothetical protein
VPSGERQWQQDRPEQQILDDSREKNPEEVFFKKGNPRSVRGAHSSPTRMEKGSFLLFHLDQWE